MGVCLYPGSICKDRTSAINVHRSIGLDNLPSELKKLKSKKNLIPKYCIQDIGYKIKINLIFFCNTNNIKNSFTYKFQLYIDNSDLEEENFIFLGSTEATICQNKIKFNKIFETNYFFSKGQRIKICCLENEKNINTSAYYLGKMMNGFDPPKLLIEKDDKNIGELLILINKEENPKLFKNKKCLFSVELPNDIKFSEEGNYFFCVYNTYDELIYKSKVFYFNNNNNNNNNNNDKQNQRYIFKFIFEIRKHFIFYKDKTIAFHLFCMKPNNKTNIISNNKNNNGNNEDNEKKEIINNNNIENNDTEYELIGSVNIKNEELLNNNGNNSFKLSNGILSSLFKDSIIINIDYKENDYTPFLEYIRFQFHLNLIVFFEDDILKDNLVIIRNVVNVFFSILSLYNKEEEKIQCVNSRKNAKIIKTNNIKEIFNENEENINKDKNDGNEEEEIKIFPVINMLLEKFIFSVENKGINKYYIILIFTNKKYSDLNDDIDISNNLDIYKKYENIPMNIKIFNVGDEDNYTETNNINMNIYNNSNEDIKYERLIFQFYNINNQNNKKEKVSKYLNDIPFLIEDYFEIQKMAKFSIFDE
jgi:hypothetical protein